MKPKLFQTLSLVSENTNVTVCYIQLTATDITFSASLSLYANTHTFANMRDILNFWAYVPNFVPRLILSRYYSVIFAMWWSQRPIWGRGVPAIHITMTFVNIVAFLYIGLASAGWDLVGLTTWDADPNNVAYGESSRSPLKQPTHPFITSH
jgi:hypothetical protein